MKYDILVSDIVSNISQPVATEVRQPCLMLAVGRHSIARTLGDILKSGRAVWRDTLRLCIDDKTWADPEALLTILICADHHTKESYAAILCYPSNKLSTSCLGGYVCYEGGATPCCTREDRKVCASSLARGVASAARNDCCVGACTGAQKKYNKSLRTKKPHGRFRSQGSKFVASCRCYHSDSCVGLCNHARLGLSRSNH